LFCPAVSFIKICVWPLDVLLLQHFIEFKFTVIQASIKQWVSYLPPLIWDFVILVSAHTGPMCTPLFQWLLHPVDTGLQVWEHSNDKGDVHLWVEPFTCFYFGVYYMTLMKKGTCTLKHC